MTPMKPGGNTSPILRETDVFKRRLYAVDMDPDLPQILPQLVRNLGFEDVRCDIQIVVLNQKLEEEVERCRHVGPFGRGLR